MTGQASALSTEADRLRANLAGVQARIARACERVERDPGTVEIVGVSKTVPAERLAAAALAGISLFGENRVQEAEAKAASLPGARWDLVGRLQSNKVARAVALFERIHSVDSVDLAERISRLATQAEVPRSPMPVFLQVNVDHDPGKAGFSEEELSASIARLAVLPGLRIEGLMTVGRLVAHREEARPTFRRLRELSERLRAVEPRLGAGLSMGMSDDFEIAVEEGATLVRLGRVLFGERPSG